MRVPSLSLTSANTRSPNAISLQSSRRCFQSRGPAPRILAAQASNRPVETPSTPPLTRPKPASAAQVAKAQPPSPPASATAVAEAYKRADEAKARGDTVTVKVTGQNEGGLVVQYGVLRGFIPYTRVEPARLRNASKGDLSALVGQTLKARVVSVDPTRKELVFSERQVAAAEALSRMGVGEVLSCVITGVEDYGAFVQVKGLPEVFGLVHKSEVSWDRILTVDQAVSIGQEVSAKVLSIDLPNCRLALSIKQLTADPLSLSLDTLSWGPAPPAGSLEPEVQALVEALRASPGVESVELTRAAQDPHHVAQELELYMTRSATEAAGQYTAVARLGVGATELRLAAAELSREQIKALLQRVARVAAQ